MAKFICIHRCPTHKDSFIVSLDERDEEGNGSGTRLTPNKCCGRWKIVKEWPLSKKQLEEIGYTFLNWADNS